MKELDFDSQIILHKTIIAFLVIYVYMYIYIIISIICIICNNKI